MTSEPLPEYQLHRHYKCLKCGHEWYQGPTIFGNNCVECGHEYIAWVNHPMWHTDRYWPEGGRLVERMEGKLKETFVAFENALNGLKDDLAEDTFAHEVYAALCNMKWRNILNYEMIYACSWRYAGELVASIRAKGEDYMEFYCSGDEGKVSNRVRILFLGLGWEPLSYDTESAESESYDEKP